jgi:hypothetical protein
MKLYKLNYFVLWLSEVLPYGNWNPSQTLPNMARYILPVAHNIKSHNTLLEIPWISSSFRRKLFGKEQARHTKECIKFLVFNTWSADQFQIYLSSWGCLPKIQYIPPSKCLPLHCQTVAACNWSFLCNNCNCWGWLTSLKLTHITFYKDNVVLAT